MRNLGWQIDCIRDRERNPEGGNLNPLYISGHKGFSSERVTNARTRAVPLKYMALHCQIDVPATLSQLAEMSHLHWCTSLPQLSRLSSIVLFSMVRILFAPASRSQWTLCE
jgi:hypothetical protein